MSIVVSLGSGEGSTLEDLLVCLDAQRCQDFELIVAFGDDGDTNEADVHQLLSRFGGGLLSKSAIKRYRAKSRAGTLNSAIAEARGRHVAVVPADALLFSDWVQELARLGATNPDAVLRLVAVEQEYVRAAWPGGADGYEAVEGPKRNSTLIFDVLGELAGSQSPPGSFAVPTRCFSELGISYEDGLGTEEDWVVFLRAASSCGVVDSDGEVTVLTRRWSDALNTTTAEDRRRAIVRLDRESLRLPSGSAGAIRSLIESEAELREQLAVAERQRNLLHVERDTAARHLEELRSRPKPVSPGASGSTVPPEITAELDAANAEIAALRASTSWRITSPLRRAIRLIRAVRR